MSERDQSPVVEDAAENVSAPLKAEELGAETHHEVADDENHEGQIREAIKSVSNSETIVPDDNNAQAVESVGKKTSILDKLKARRLRYSGDVSAKHKKREAERVKNVNGTEKT